MFRVAPVPPPGFTKTSANTSEAPMPPLGSTKTSPNTTEAPKVVEVQSDGADWCGVGIQATAVLVEKFREIAPHVPCASVTCDQVLKMTFGTKIQTI